MKNKITGMMCFEFLAKNRKLSFTAKLLGEFLGTDSRAVATALRKFTRSGQVRIRYYKGMGYGAHYKFARISPKTK